MTSELVFYVKLYVKPDRIDEWLRSAETIIDAMSREEAFIACHLHRDSEDPCLFTLYERWAEPSVQAWLDHQMKPYRKEYDARLETLLQRPREAQVLTPLREWRKDTTGAR
jgi:quinol monooxygenase YgiN